MSDTVERPRITTRTKATVGGAAGAAVAFGLFIALVQEKEGTVETAYKDSVGIWTICTGHTGPDVKPGMKLTPEQCYELLDADGKKAWNAVPRLVDLNKITYGQWIAYADFIVNAGEGNFRTSSMRRYALQGKLKESCDSFLLWVKADKGRVDCRIRSNNCIGVVYRRQTERAFCMGFVGP